MATEVDPATSPLRVDVRREDGAAVVALVGEFDLASIEVARSALEQALEDKPTEVTIDLRGLSFIDSSGISFLLLAAREDGASRLRFLPSEAPSVRRVFRVTGVEGIFGGGDSGADPA